MQHKKKLILLALSLIILIAWRQQSATTEITKWIINENSSLQVNGSTNINKFSCEIKQYDHNDTLVVQKTNNEINLSGSIDLNIQSFDCHNSMMTNDLRKTLKEKEFPMLHIRFLSLNELPALTNNAKPITGFVDIELAGNNKRYKVNYKISVDDQKVIHLLGIRDVNFSDFNLVPPKRLGGMVKSKDKLSVVFNLKMKATD